jgi:fatty acid synthase
MKLETLRIKPFIRSNNWISTFNIEEFSTDYSYFMNSLVKPVMFNEALLKIPANTTIIDICPKSIYENLIKDYCGSNTKYIAFDANLKNLLSGIGKLYEIGFNPQIKKLYPEVQYPVSNGTPFISPLIKWDHSKKW